MNKEFEGKYAIVTGGVGGSALKVPRFLLKKVYQELSLLI